MQNIEQKIINYFFHEFGEKVNENTTFFTDLDIYGEDGERFIETFSIIFEVDMEKFPFDDFFLKEEEIKISLSGLIRTIFYGPIKWKTFDFPHLVNVVICGYWFSPPNWTDE